MHTTYPPLFVLALAISLGTVVVPGAASSAMPPSHDATLVVHVLNRLGYGPAPGEVARVQAMGIDAYIDAQLKPARIAESPAVTERLARLSTLTLDPVALFKEYGPPRRARGERPDPEAVRAARERARVIVLEAAEARLVRAVASPRQLEEVMVDFWFNHFNVFVGKGLDHLWVGSYEQHAIRPHALGRFRDLLGATARHPAMLFYLDNWQNTAPESRGARGRFKGLNENYARELLELHTLGVDGGYTQADVEALARIFTGWGLGAARRDAQGGFYFDARRHDDSDKVLLGTRIRGGMEEGERALDLLARHPATARHVSFKLAQYFVADEPPPALIGRLSARFLETDGDIRAVLATLLESPEFRDPRHRAQKFKTPYHYVVSALRATGTVPDDARPLLGTFMQLGMPLYGCQTPNGYANTQAAWLNPDGMTRRLSFATALGAGRLPIGAGGAPDAQALERALGTMLRTETRAALKETPAPLRAGLMLGSPEFMYR